jgi:hypothetical protein
MKVATLCPGAGSQGCRHPGPEPGSRCSPARQEGRPRLRAGVTGKVRPHGGSGPRDGVCSSSRHPAPDAGDGPRRPAPVKRMTPSHRSSSPRPRAGVPLFFNPRGSGTPAQGRGDGESPVASRIEAEERSLFELRSSCSGRGRRSSPPGTRQAHDAVTSILATPASSRGPAVLQRTRKRDPGSGPG